MRVLQGEAIDSIPILRKSPNVYMFDYSQLKRWGLAEHRLPRGSILINKPDSYFKQYKTALWIVGLIIAGLTIMVILFMSANIRKRKLAEGALAREHNLLRSLIDNIPDNIYVKDTASRFVACNIAAMRYVGQDTLEEVYGKTDFDFLPQELAQEYFDSEQKIFRTGQALINQEETNVEPCTGKQHYFVTTKIPFFDQQEEES